MGLELGQSSAASGDSEATEVDDAATESGAPRRSVLAPFMIASSADDAVPEEDSDDPDEASDERDEASDDAASNARPDEAPQRGDAVSPAASDTDGVTAEASEDNEAPATPGAATRAAATADPAAAADPAATAASGIPAARSATASPGGATGPPIESGVPERAAVDVDGPLLEDAEVLRTNWLRLQAGFVDDPHEAVSDAADLVEHTAQALVGALRMRQQKLREMWDGGRPKGSGSADAGKDGQGAKIAAPDTTEQLRLLMQRYRVLFNHICGS